jgi:heme/copper-type cytochrome/quinol oxidase subunit 2
VTIKGKQVTPPPATVDLPVGETLTLTVTSDHADELHLHGFDIEKPLVPGTPLTVTVTGKDPGVYEVETHEPPLRLLQIAVR